MRADLRSCANARCCSLRLLFAAVLAVLALLACGGGAAQAAGGPACGGQATSHQATNSIDLPGGTAIAKWFGEKAAGKLAGDGAGMAFNYLSELIGLNKILPESDEAKVLKKLDEIKLELTGVSERLDQLTELVGQLISEERQFHLDTALTNLCSTVRKNEVLYEQQYAPMVRAASELGQILAGPNPEKADQKGPSGFSPRERVERLQKDFIRVYENNELGLEEGIKDIHAALVPGALQDSVLAAYGQVLMTKRFLDRGDSERLLDLYTNLAEGRALASWMAAEYRASSLQNPEALENVMKNFVRDSATEQKNLPLMISPGVVIDLGKANSLTTTGKPVWFPPSAEDQGWLPTNTLPEPFGNIAVGQVNNQINALNTPKADKAVRGVGWAVPNKVQLTALLSDGCIADPANPTKYLNGACKNAIGPKTGTNVAGYLLKLNPSNQIWQQLFCQSGPVLTCDPGSGPGAGEAPPHAFIWTNEPQGQKVKCGWTIIPPDQYSRTYTTYTGFRTLKTTASQGAFPALPEKTPGYGLQEGTIAHTICDTFFTGLFRGTPSRNIPPSPAAKGIVMATRNTNAEDLNPINGIDYMAQRSPGCDGKPATIIGTNGNDRLRGTPGPDVIVAGGGDDVVRALGGQDLVCGNGGDDLLIGGRGNDRLFGQADSDVLRGGPGKNVLRGGRG
jgi:hypothetical protein